MSEFPPNVPIRHNFPTVGPRPPAISVPCFIISSITPFQSTPSGTLTVVRHGNRHFSCSTKHSKPCSFNFW
ncbi:unnamed protein product [Haemonchus placei]|uniref:Uncharacterized protein n=1 Tax=Haemonchus placei TaxID=6290 RepID=A0A3P7W7P9_HAEPC|nr:unnamed protein product [Haemonchus placei]